MKNLKKFQISKENQKSVKGGNMQPDPTEKCCELSQNLMYCVRSVPHNQRC